jgi:hypothetical protein
VSDVAFAFWGIVGHVPLTAGSIVGLPPPAIEPLLLVVPEPEEAPFEPELPLLPEELPLEGLPELVPTEPELLVS